MSYLFTSESVSEGHPDKVADAISDAVLDLVMSRENPADRCACETLVTTNKVIIAGEYKGILHDPEVHSTIKRLIKHIGYEQEGFDWKSVQIINLMHGQSADIALGTDNFGAGDQGLMFGFACNETESYMPSAIYWSHRIVESLAAARKNQLGPCNLSNMLGPDAKSQVTMEYDDNHKPVRIAKIVCSTQHKEDCDIDYVRQTVQGLIKAILPQDLIDSDTEFFINPTGRFVIGGPDGDTGLTGRKIIVDTYGGYAPHGGGAFSGKDPTKVDRSAAYMMRYLAKNIVASGKATRATCQVSYAIGVEKPMSFYIDSDGDNTALTKWVQDNVDLRPKAIIDRFDMFRPIYSQTTNYGHFGKVSLPWEEINLF